MKTVGFTYDLRDDYLGIGFSHEEVAEFDQIETIDAIEHALSQNGYRIERIGNIKSLVAMLARGRRWDFVFNICEGIKGIARESQVPNLLEAFDIPCVFSASEVMMLTMDKALAKRIILDAGISTARYAVVRTPADLDNVKLEYPHFVKPLAEGTGKGITAKSVVHDKDSLLYACRFVIEQYNQPALVEHYLSGRELTVGIIGTADSARVLGVLEAVIKEGAEPGSQSFYNKENCEKLIEYKLVKDTVAIRAGEVALASWRALHCCDGGRVDLRCDESGVPHFLEVNPLAGLHPTHSDLPILASAVGMDHVTLIGEIMKAFEDRLMKKTENVALTTVPHMVLS